MNKVTTGEMQQKGPKPKRSLPVCGNPKCCSSTSIADTVTHGWGRLDHNGFWEYECPDPRHIEQDRELERKLKGFTMKKPAGLRA